MPDLSAEFWIAAVVAAIALLLGIGVTLAMDAKTKGEFQFASVCFLVSALLTVYGIVEFQMLAKWSSGPRIILVYFLLALVIMLTGEAIRWANSRHKLAASSTPQSQVGNKPDANSMAIPPIVRTNPPTASIAAPEKPPVATSVDAHRRQQGIPAPADADLSGPGPTQGGFSDSISIVVTPASPKGGAMSGEFQTSGRGENEIDILNVPPEELLFKPPGVTVERSSLPVKLLINGHNMTIVRFTDKGFVINDNGWRDILIQVALVKPTSRLSLPTPTPRRSAPQAAPPLRVPLESDLPQLPQIREKADYVMINIGEGGTGGAGASVPIEALRKGPFHPFKFAGYDPITIQMDGDTLLFSFVAWGGSGEPPLEIHNNEFTVRNPRWDRNSNANELEVINPDGTVVFQLIRKSPTNILITGIFPLPNGTLLVAGHNGAIETDKVLPSYLPQRIFKYPSWRYPGKYADGP